MEALAGHHNAEIEKIKENGDFIGADSREGAHRACRNVIEDYERPHPRLYRGNVSDGCDRIRYRLRVSDKKAVVVGQSRFVRLVASNPGCVPLKRSLTPAG